MDKDLVASLTAASVAVVCWILPILLFFMLFLKSILKSYALLSCWSMAACLVISASALSRFEFNSAFQFGSELVPALSQYLLIIDNSAGTHFKDLANGPVIHDGFQDELILKDRIAVQKVKDSRDKRFSSESVPVRIGFS